MPFVERIDRVMEIVLFLRSGRNKNFDIGIVPDGLVLIGKRRIRGNDQSVDAFFIPCKLDIGRIFRFFAAPARVKRRHGFHSVPDFVRFAVHSDFFGGKQLMCTVKRAGIGMTVPLGLKCLFPRKGEYSEAFHFD